MTKSISVAEGVLALCSVKARIAGKLTLDEAADLATWCNCQRADLWEDMTLQECLNVHRVSAEWETWESWAEEDWRAAYAAWNRAVVDPGNKMVSRTDRAA